MTVDLLITLYTVLLAENALFVSMYGADELDKLTDDVRKMGISGLFFFISTLISEIIVVLTARYVLPNPRDTLIIIIPIVTFFVMSGMLLALHRLKPDVYAELKLLAPVFAVNTASAGIIYESVVSTAGLTDALTASLLATVSVILSFALFVSIKERIIKANLPSPMRGIPILLVTAGIIAMILTGFAEMRF